MKNPKLLKLNILLCVLFLNLISNAQTPNYLELDFSKPTKYVINNIVVEGNKYVETPLVVIYSNLSIGETLEVPSQKFTEISTNIWKQELFDDVKVYLKSVKGDTVDVIIQIAERPRLSRYTFPGLKRSEARNIKDELTLTGNMIINQNLINNTQNQILKYYYSKGYYSAKVNIAQNEDPDRVNAKIFRIYITKGPKTKLWDIQFDGNKEVSSSELRKALKSTKRKKNKINVFKSAKFIESDYESDKNLLLLHYYTKGYRDAKIVSDELVKHSDNLLVLKIKINEGKKYYFRDIKFSGSTKFNSEILHKILDIQKGDVFNQSKLDQKLYASPDGLDITGLYMDDGYLFFNVTPIEVQVDNDSIDIEIKMTEGEQAILRNMRVFGNYKTSDHVILRELRTRPGQKFSRSDIQRTIRELGALGLFDPQQIGVVPKPNPSDGTVDIEYTVVERASDQIELSGGIGPGWQGAGGQSRTQFVGTLGLVLNNFSTRKLIRPKLWNPIPVGDGQKLSLRGQSSGFFQSYNFSFTEPWMGGKKPNSFTTSIYHSVFNLNQEPRGSDRRKALYTTGASVSLGRRLRKPDDNFTLMNSVGFQMYRVQNGRDFFIIMDNGRSRTFEFKTVLSRNAIEGGFIFPTGGSSFSLSLALTPPFSLFRNVDFKNASPEKKYEWVEYHKWKFDAEWYTKPFNSLKFVLAAKTKLGIMGYYNSDIGFSPFERFIIGGSGLTNVAFNGAEIVSQRGYDDRTISTNASGNSNVGATIFNKYSLELRYPITDNPNATVYLLSFLEAGNAWVSFDNYNPFALQRATGVGVRLFLPMFGLIGLDYGYGFDFRKVQGNANPGHFHFYLGQQF
jgi:outer membrane protein insertion porin family